MASLTPRISPGKLASLLEALTVRVESARVEDHSLSLPDYPGGPRPSSVVRLSGGGHSGLGENVAFLAQDHARFAVFVARWFVAVGERAGLTVRAARSAEGTPYERAALEAALIDLGLRQARLGLADLTGVREASLRFVKSLATDPEPVVVIRRLREQGFHGQLKVDVDPAWNGSLLEALAQDASIAIFDFKGRGDAPLVRRLCAAHSRAWLEDPPPDFEASTESERSRVSRDAPLLDEGAVVAALARGQKVNLKAPRMGGPLSVLRGLEHAWLGAQSDPSPRAYLGGMFEVGCGRVQARQLAALYCSSAPNDLALNVPAAHGVELASPAQVRLDQPGFGAG